MARFVKMPSSCDGECFLPSRSESLIWSIVRSIQCEEHRATQALTPLRSERLRLGGRDGDPGGEERE